MEDAENYVGVGDCEVGGDVYGDGAEGDLGDAFEAFLCCAAGLET